MSSRTRIASIFRKLNSDVSVRNGILHATPRDDGLPEDDEW